MISFKTVWDDVQNIVNNNEELDIDIIEKYDGGFVIKHHDDTTFINKQDFVGVWCRIQCDDKVCVGLHELGSKDEVKEHYVCKILKHLPYIEESLGILRISQ